MVVAVKRATQGAVLLAVGTVLVSFTVSGAFQSYVRTGLRIPLILAGLCLLAIGGIAVIAGPEEVVADDGHGHGHTTMRVGMLLLGFVAAAYLISPAPLGAYAAGRGNENRRRNDRGHDHNATDDRRGAGPAVPALDNGRGRPNGTPTP